MRRTNVGWLPVGLSGPLYSVSPLGLQGCLPGPDAETDFTYTICWWGLPTLPAGSASGCWPRCAKWSDEEGKIAPSRLVIVFPPLHQLRGVVVTYETIRC